MLSRTCTLTAALSLVLVAGGLLSATVRGTPVEAASVCTPMNILDGESDVGTFGMEVAAVGDLNGDGFDEMFVGAPGFLSDTIGRGFVYSGADQSLLFTITGEVNGDMFGAGAAGADFNGDGFSDLLVSAPDHSGLTQGGGRVYVFYGGPGPFPADRSASIA